MEKFPTEESARAQLVYAQLQVEALVDMNAKLQRELRASTVSGTRSSSTTQQQQQQQHPAISGDEVRALAQTVDRLVAALDPSQRASQPSQVSVAAPALDLAVVTEKLAAVALPLAILASDSLRRLRSEVDDAKQQIADGAMRDSLAETVSRQREEKLRAELERANAAEKASAARCDELTRQLHYLKRFQIALCTPPTTADDDGGDDDDEPDTHGIGSNANDSTAQLLAFLTAKPPPSARATAAAAIDSAAL